MQPLVRASRATVGTGRSRALLAVLVGVVATAVAWFRLPADARDTLWAEDAAVFLTQRLEHGPWATLVLPYDGYQHLLPRLLTDLATALPTAGYARTVTALCCVVVGLVAAGVVVFAAPTVRHPVTLACFALVPVLTPVVAFEVLGDTANLHTFLLFLVPVLLLTRPRSVRSATGAALVVFVVALSEVQSVLFAPLLLATVRRRTARPVAAGYVLGVLLQVVSTTVAPRVRAPVRTPVGDVVTGWFLEPVYSVLYPRASSAAERLAQSGPALPLVLAAVLVGAAAVVLVGRWRRGDGLGDLRTLAVTMLVASPLVWSVDVLLNPTPFIAFGEHGPELLGQVGYVRYAAAPSMFLVALLVLAAERGLRTGRTWAVVLAVVVLVATVGLLIARAAPHESARDGATTWTQELRDGRRECEAGAPDTRVLQAPHGWGVTLDCRTVDSGAFR